MGAIMHLSFDEVQYQVEAEGLTIRLLPKEYALLAFLYSHQGRAYSREQLLDQVWPMEYPVERTVDDHVYRLRKKLSVLHGLEIRTVRGQGYSLVLKEQTGLHDTVPAARDPALNQAMRNVFGKYHTYGQGRSMMILARQQDVLGYELDPFYAVYLHFVQGDVEWLLRTEEYPWKSRFYFLLLFYMYTGDSGQRMAYCETVLERGLLPVNHHTELEILNIVDLYILDGYIEKAMERLRLTEQFISEHPDYSTFLPYAIITLMFAHIVAESGDAVIEQLAARLETSILVEKPYLREMGGFRIATGLWKLRQRKHQDAERYLDEGLAILEKSGFVPLQLHALHRIMHYVDRLGDDKLRSKYKSLYQAFFEQFLGNGLLQTLETAMQQALR
ncbi:winged helix-turn-helix domain-containing protein [Paenibacillus mesotrionivorans]|uniref:Winged helix-turn-helix domain-containing protein n=1 Tax=Paenibacillus mesotrionivorans TaxID=3160968 RepID=A0ACC7NUN8_9BACL